MINALVAFEKHMTELATMMESELANGITKKSTNVPGFSRPAR